jgi:hypothetical protein
MTLKDDNKIYKVGNDLISLEDQINEGITLLNNILLNFEAIYDLVASDTEAFSAEDRLEVQSYISKAKQKIKLFANNL